MKKLSSAGYNERLFSGGLRGKLHLARFSWLEDSVRRSGSPCRSVLELGCFDGKAIDHLPETPSRYVGLDANWEGGLDIARERWKGHDGYEFRECTTPDEMGIGDESFDISVCMETLEHVPPELVEPYVAKLAAATRHHVFITVPNEIGVVFFLKHVAKSALGGDTEKYGFVEFLNQSAGRTAKVARREHKGFDYRDMVRAVSRHFDIVEVSGNPLGRLPAALNFGVGIVGAKRRAADAA